MRSLHLLAHIVLQWWRPESIDHLILLILLGGGIGRLSNLLGKRRHHTVIVAVVSSGQRTLQL
jgi:hypothetical protein